MFNKKQNKPNISINPDFSSDELEREQREINDRLNQLNQRNQQFQPPLQQIPPILQIQPPQIPQQQYTQQYQPQPQNQQRQAEIIEAKKMEDGSYVYVIVTNYPLIIGECQLN